MTRSEKLRRAGRETGFSYLWLLFLVAVIGVGLSVAAEVAVVAAQRDKEKELLAIGRQFRTAIARYYEAPGPRREYPTSLADLLQDPRTPQLRRHLRRIFVDPLTRQAEWGLVRVGGRIVGVHSLSTQRPLKQDGFDADDSAFVGQQQYAQWIFTYPPDLLLPKAAAAATAPPSIELKTR